MSTRTLWINETKSKESRPRLVKGSGTVTSRAGVNGRRIARLIRARPEMRTRASGGHSAESLIKSRIYIGRTLSFGADIGTHASDSEVV